MSTRDASPSPASSEDNSADLRPVAPGRPDNDDCCGSGCNPCIFDLYDEAMARHYEALEAWKKRNARRT